MIMKTSISIIIFRSPIKMKGMKLRIWGNHLKLTPPSKKENYLFKIKHIQTSHILWMVHGEPTR